jgi:hypothetical protein
MEEEESGWKYIHGDVFRFPPSKSLFCAFVGTGTQIFFLSLFIFALALIGVFYPYNRCGKRLFAPLHHGSRPVALLPCLLMCVLPV